MAKILVADDNSNIQKMVGLALRDQGIDVVAVGNGEAAVRKISDVHPDLVLADVFMPVRNGYEVCQYVKGDSALAHIPVILLVGAFDPLDEQEAQRVGADGVLKKPFVPPDPLISMVKSALARAGVSIGGAPVAPAPKEEPPHVADMLTPRTPPSAIPLPPVEDFPTVENEPISEGMAAPPPPIRIDEGSQPLAFGNLLETPTPEQEDDLAYATTARPELERDWKSGNEEEEEVEEEEEEETATSSWRRDGGDDSGTPEEESSKPGSDWRETAFGDTPAGKSRGEAWTPQKEISRFQEAADVEHGVTAVVTETPVAETKPGPVPLAPVAPATLTQAPQGPFSQDAWAAALGEAPAARANIGEAPDALTQKEEAPVSPYAAESIIAQANETLAAPESEKPAGEPWYSAVSSPWEAEVQKASQLAATWDAPPEAAKAAPEPVTVAKEDPAATVDVLPASLSEDVKAKVEEAALPAGTVEAIREETQQVTDTVMEQAPLAPLAPLAPAAKEAPQTAQPSMEDLVAKVLAQMSPEVLQAVTREILKPVVEAMVRDELNARKQ